MKNSIKIIVLSLLRQRLINYAGLCQGVAKGRGMVAVNITIKCIKYAVNSSFNTLSELINYLY